MQAGFKIVSVVLFCTGVLYFLFPVGWFGDDGNLLYYAKNHTLSDAQDIFFFKDHSMQRYRPGMQLWAVFNYNNFGLDSVLLRGTAWLTCGGIAWLLFAIMKQLRFNALSIILAIGWFFLAPVKMQSLFRVGRPELSETFFILLSLYFLVKGGSQGIPISSKTKYFLASTFFALISCLWTELGISSFFVLSMWILFCPNLDFTSENQNYKLRFLLFPVAGLLIYLFWYYSLGAPFTVPSVYNERYQIGLGINSIRNIMVSFLGCISPVSSATIAAIYTSNFRWLIYLVGILTILVSILGIIKTRGHNTLLREYRFLLPSFVVSTIPFVFVKHVSEVYLLHSNVYISMMIGLGAGAYFKSWPNLNKKLKIVLLVLISVLLMNNIISYFFLKRNSTLFDKAVKNLKELKSEKNLESITVYEETGKHRFSQYFLPFSKIVNFSDSTMPKVLWKYPPILLDSLPAYKIDWKGVISEIR